jgi:hypothetical protein
VTPTNSKGFAISQGEIFIDYAGDGNIAKVREMLASDPDVVSAVYADALPDMAVHAVAAQGNIELLELLLAHGADLNAAGDGNRRPLHYAAQWGHLEVVKWLVEHGADVNAQAWAGRTPLLEAAYSREPTGDVRNFLLQHGAKMELNTALGLWRTDEVRRLLEDPHVLENCIHPTHLLHDVTIFMSAKINEGHYGATSVDPDHVDRVIAENIDILDSIIALDPPIEAQIHATAVTSAVQIPHPAVLERLLKYNSDLPQDSLRNSIRNSLWTLAQLASASARADEMLAVLRRYNLD